MSESTLPKPLPLTVFTAATAPGIYSWSSFDSKLEARLRFSHRAYVRAPGAPNKGPRGKVPYITIGTTNDQQNQQYDSNETVSHKEGVKLPATMGDSTLIAKTLVEIGELEDLNAGLDPMRRAQDLMIRTLIEERIYWFSVRSPLFRYPPVSPLDAAPESPTLHLLPRR